MKNDNNGEAVTVFLQNLPGAVSKLKNRLQQDYEQAYPGFGNIIRIVLDREEARAWRLSPFPHLLLPGLVEARVAQLGLQPVSPRSRDALPQSDFRQIQNHHLFPALCGS